MTNTETAKISQSTTEAAVALATQIAKGMIARGISADVAQSMAADFASKLATRQFASAASMLAA